MKHCNENEKLHELIDGELDPAEKVKFEKHLSVCHECRNLFDPIHQNRTFFIAQPPILPDAKFDRVMLDLIERKNAKNAEKIGFFTIFSTLPLKHGFASLIAVMALIAAFQFGKMSASNIPSAEITQTPPVENDSDRASVTKEAIVLQPQKEIVTQIKTVTKYVEVPVIKKIKEERIIYVDKSENAVVKNEILPEKRSEFKQEALAKQFNLKDLQPVGEVSYQIIRKGENNEE